MVKIRPEVTKKSFSEHINPIISNPLNAIIELIANAYDSGATELNITWPTRSTLDNKNNANMVIFKDNGHGMSSDEFPEIWKELSYDCILKQTKSVTFTFEGESITRETYGRNGKGRHAPFAFSDNYKVKTIKNGKLSIFNIERDLKGFTIEQESYNEVFENSGTEISFHVDFERNVEIDDIRQTIATRFIKDNSFKITLNNELIKLTDVNDEKIK